MNAVLRLKLRSFVRRNHFQIANIRLHCKRTASPYQDQTDNATIFTNMKAIMLYHPLVLNVTCFLSTMII